MRGSTASHLDEPEGLTVPEDPTPRPLGLARGLGLGAFFTLLAVLSLQPLSTTANRLPDNADGVHFAWLLAWLSHQATSEPPRLFAANILHPEPAALAYGEPMLSLAPLAWPVFALTGNAALAYDVSLVVTLVLSAAFAFLLARELTGSAAAGVVAALIFAFTTANFDSVARIQIVSSQWTPLTLFFLVRCLRTGRLGYGLATGASFALQSLACSYYELYFAILLVVTAPLFLRIPRRIPWKPLIAGAALAAAIVLPINLIQLSELNRVGTDRPFRQPATWASYTQAMPQNWLYGDAFGLPETRYDDRYFPGFLPVGLAAMGLGLCYRAYRRSRGDESDDRPAFILAIATLSGLAFMLAFGERIPTPLGKLPGPFALFVDWVPGLSGTRVPSRFIMFLRLGMALLSAVAVAWGLSRARRRVVVASLAILLPLEHLSTPLPTWTFPTHDSLPPVYARLAEIARTQPGPIVEFPPNPVRLRRGESLWEYMSTFHWLPIVNGFSSYYPAQYDFVVDALLDLPDQQSFEMLRTLGVEYLVFHPADPGHIEGQRAIERFEERLHRIDHQIELIAAFDDAPGSYEAPWTVLGGERLYRIRPRTTPRPRRTRIADLTALPREGWGCEAHPQNGRCERALDGDFATAFETSTPQRDGHFFRVLFPRPVEVQAIALVQGGFAPYYPRRVEIGVLVEGEWAALRHQPLRVEFLEALLSRDPRAALELVLPRSRVEGVELRLALGREAFNPWYLPEIQIFN